VSASQVLVFDAGSSGTRIHVFNILLGAMDTLVPRIDMSVREKQTKKIKPGLSSYADRSDLDGAQKSITELLAFASQWVPVDRRSSTPVLLKATAGLRAVKPPEKATQVLERVRETLSSSGYMFKPVWADIIQGKEEAGLAWVAANFLQGNLGQPSGASSLGIIEMGGGSTQVTFQVVTDEISRMADTDTFTFKNMAGQRYTLYAHSYLGYGLDHAQAKLRSLTTGDQDPCYPVGYMRKSVEDSSQLVKGSGNAELCQELIKSQLMPSSETISPGRYSFEMPLRGNFVATENFFYVRNDLNLPMDGNMAAMKDAAKNTCAKPLSLSPEQEAVMLAGTADPSKQKSCFGLSFQVALLDALRVSQVQIAHTINGGDIDWALGAALVHFLESDMSQKARLLEVGGNSAGFAQFVVLLSVVGLVGAARFWFGPRLTKQVAVVGSVVKATALGRGGYTEVATKPPL